MCLTFGRTDRLPSLASGKMRVIVGLGHPLEPDDANAAIADTVRRVEVTVACGIAGSADRG